MGKNEFGGTTVSRLFWLLLFAGIAYAAWVWIPVQLIEFRIGNQARALGNEALTTERRDRDLVSDFIATVEARTGIKFHFGQVRLRRDRSKKSVEIELEYDIPVVFPLIDRIDYKHVEMVVEQTRSRAY